MSLDKEINNARLQVHTDSYPMSIGKKVNIYRDFHCRQRHNLLMVFSITRANLIKIFSSS